MGGNVTGAWCLPDIKGHVLDIVAANSQSRVPLSWITNQIEELDF